ncbi:hypothetical protein [Burkholderia glumae]|nr:hypothetical protein [Burkholderia glumae]
MRRPDHPQAVFASTDLSDLGIDDLVAAIALAAERHGRVSESEALVTIH